jgi:hypothetical protein
MVNSMVNSRVNNLINSIRCYFIAFVAGFAIITSNVVFAENYQDHKPLPFNPECGVNIAFTKIPKITKLTTPINEQVSLFSKNYISVQVAKGARIASNVSCQKLTKAKYTASEQEWQNILKTNFQQLAEKGFREVTLSPLVAEDAFFKGEEQSREYIMKAVHNNATQVFYLANILNKSQNTLYTVMISGNISVMTEVKTEYQRVIASLGTLH